MAAKRGVRIRVLAASVAILVAASVGAQEAGVSRELAASRAARVSDVGYEIAWTVMPHAASMAGHEVMRFMLGSAAAQQDLPVDFRDGTLRSAALHGASVPLAAVAGHLVLPGAMLRPGLNTVELDFQTRIAASGAAITRYDDKEDGSEYLYSLYVPMDASMAFPCFDQPDLKARFTLTLETPAAWTAVGNTAGLRAEKDGRATTRFAETKPISTYLFAFAAGPWTKVHAQAGLPDVYARRSQLARATPEVPQLQEITARGMQWLADYFQQPFPFPKYDMVLIPGFPFGGMEHAGATFLREDAVLFRSAPTASDRFGRNTLTLHELTHQWFGDLVTMRWFDDLWLKEGFAQYMAYQALAALEPAAGTWKHFAEDIKPLAYGIDETEGTTPIFQNIANLKDAKSAYGAIVYQKAPAILKQLEFRLGDEAFRDGLRIYLREHAYSNAQWSDLIAAFHAASGQDVQAWANAWVLRRGMPEVTVRWSCNAKGGLESLQLMQQDVLADRFVWPISTEVLLAYPASGRAGRTLRVDSDAAVKDVAVGAATLCPDYVFANAGDEAYGRFLLDERSEAAVRRQIRSGGLQAASTDPLLRSMLWASLWENVHVARSAPREYVELALEDLRSEDDETLARIQGGRSLAALHNYMTAAGRAPLVLRLETVAAERMLHAPATGVRIVSFRTLVSATESEAGRARLKDLLEEKLLIPDVQLRPLDRWTLVGKLIALNDADAPKYFAAEVKRDTTSDGPKFAWAVQAGAPSAKVKAKYFAELTQAPADAAARPEDWLTQAVRPFNGWDQSALTEPYVRRALDQLPEIKRDRKIFFLGAWLSAFLGGQNSAEAEAAVDAWLAQPGIDADLRLKVLENVDELRRTVRIRQRFPD